MQERSEGGRWVRERETERDKGKGIVTERRR